METYYAYLRWCRDYNERNLIDPTSDKMEWHHTLPQCVFGDIRIGLWLTLKQHAIATALQTLAFGRNCLCPWHIQYLPESLWELCRPTFSNEKRKNGLTGGSSSVSLGVGLHNPANKEVCRVNSVKNGIKLASTLYRCTVTGHIAPAGPLAVWQRARGIDHKDPNNRRRIS
jgi:hypothetical protein